ncbi:MAG: hypothetical protein FWD97_06155 [Defluviitaleaceae bacterium]|nr:hypothetical protein [Defluviitaleaceae bacterium]
MSQPMQKPTKRNRRRLRVEVFFAFVLLLLGIYVAGYVYTHVLQADVEQMRIEAGYVDPPTAFNGVIIRDEAVYRGVTGVNLNFHVEEFRRVRAGHMVAGGISVSRPGVVSFHVDGLENAFTPANMGNIPRNAIQAQTQRYEHYIEETAEDYETPIRDAFRVVRGNDWFVAAYVPMPYAQNWFIDLSLTIFMQDDEELVPLNVSVYRLLHDGDDVYVVFRTNSSVLRFINHRFITFQLQQNPVQGLKIPTTALVELSAFPVPRDFAWERYGMMTTDHYIGNGETVIEPVSGWVSSDGTTFYILADGSNLRVGDTIIHEGIPFTLDFIRAVPGVFVANRGHALFRQVTLPLHFDYNNSGFIILDIATNPYIRLFDWIVVDGQNVDNRLLLN